jgi:hypothetical protein
MKIIKVILLTLWSVSSFGQADLNSDVATEFVHRKINELNIKIWNAVRAGTLTAYVNDSLFKNINTKAIEESISMEYTVMVPNPDNPNDPYDLMGVSVSYEFDSISGYSGCLLAYENELVEESVISKLKAIAPVFKPLEKKGASFIRTPVFWVKVDDIKKDLQGEFKQFWPLLRLRTTIMDFEKIQFSPGWPLKKEEYLVSQCVNSHLAFLDFNAKNDSLIGEYLSKILLEIVNQYSYDLTVYRDLELSSEYENIHKELRDSTGVMVPNPEFPDDPYAFIEKMLYWDFDFSEMKNIQVIKDKEIILTMFSSIVDFNGYTIKPKQLFIPYDSLKPYLQPHDRTILESLMSETAIKR